ncbi:Outer dense fiber protein 3 [Holothuria leucospilota]|uniref:Outer dense fiber protein 3 n=1 Tax=Holothuria leucospilota TaxID=206669 RepID=A0A9Q1BTN5_HOLLE|nr:Outer dense fiber protein 3 [Holothuria leucospilota]
MTDTYQPTIPRGDIAAKFASPGPKYALPSNTGTYEHDIRKKKAPAYSFGGRYYKIVDDCSPGPRYLVDPRISRFGGSGEPHYSLYSRPQDPARFSTPGPGKYSPEKAGKSAHFSAPAYSFGSRTKGSKFDKSPAPNNYSLPQILGGRSIAMSSAPVYSMTGRSKIGGFDADLQKTPGPCTYNVTNPSIYKNKRPQYSMTGRNVMPSDSTMKPGPGAHSPEKVYINRRKYPSFSFGIKHSEYTTPNIFEPTD